MLAAVLAFGVASAQTDTTRTKKTTPPTSKSRNEKAKQPSNQKRDAKTTRQTQDTVGRRRNDSIPGTGRPTDGKRRP